MDKKYNVKKIVTQTNDGVIVSDEKIDEFDEKKKKNLRMNPEFMVE